MERNFPVMKLIFATLLIIPLVECSLQKVAAKGRLMCGNKPASDVQVKLVDKDVVSDDVMDKKTTDNSGNFYVEGSADELTKIDPVLKIYHSCDHSLLCKRRWSLKIPSHYIVKGNQQPKPMDFGTMNLEARLEEDRNCI
ncbi:Transthyretin-like protein 46 [Trichinella pseudospiralis]|uniref:Transthyretin-like protein 46 n=2 Tax=Trichinella pseudospiralis TaxID=6337 RepID=A0A0V1IXV9_TRIPS|nr:Transthyretin-like protein 46 [Trichinella pseudospiralis]KRX87590.1 Transthyretin-like protein 46 [Trichinella pseudospiralis]KRY73074.1 Transthyretin-like protein 46 [Trichinella pseudospiralis]KRY88954.1 Transthyretin-like protein 46 [Trichinella pseudospiralis]KRZ27556.1 Transthyretin-like protein 46 [Trichinella pseudospiralis]